MKNKLITLVIALFITGCANNMVLFDDDINGYRLSSSDLPSTDDCLILKSAYLKGQNVRVEKGTRYVDPRSATDSFYQCQSGDASCRNVNGKLTILNKTHEDLISSCRNDAITAKQSMSKKTQVKKAQIKKAPQTIAQAIQSNTKQSFAVEELFKQLHKNGHTSTRNEEYLFMNFNFFMTSLVDEVDITDLLGTIILGTSSPVFDPEMYELSRSVSIYPYQVERVNSDMVILECGKCKLPVVGVIRVDGRPSSIEGQVFNDERAVYKFKGTSSVRTIMNDQKQIFEFERITLEKIGLPRNHLKQIIKYSQPEST